MITHSKLLWVIAGIIVGSLTIGMLYPYIIALSTFADFEVLYADIRSDGTAEIKIKNTGNVAITRVDIIFTRGAVGGVWDPPTGQPLSPPLGPGEELQIRGRDIYVYAPRVEMLIKVYYASGTASVAAVTHAFHPLALLEKATWAFDVSAEVVDTGVIINGSHVIKLHLIFTSHVDFELYGDEARIYESGGTTPLAVLDLSNITLPPKGTADAWFNVTLSAGEYVIQAEFLDADGTKYARACYITVGERKVTIYLISIEGAQGWWVDPDLVRQWAEKYADVYTITTWDELYQFIFHPDDFEDAKGLPTRHVIVINCHGEGVPGLIGSPGWPSTWQEYYDTIRQDIAERGWIWVSPVGYAFYYVVSSTREVVGPDGVLRILGLTDASKNNQWSGKEHRIGLEGASWHDFLDNSLVGVKSQLTKELEAFFGITLPDTISAARAQRFPDFASDVRVFYGTDSSRRGGFLGVFLLDDFEGDTIYETEPANPASYTGYPNYWDVLSGNPTISGGNLQLYEGDSIIRKKLDGVDYFPDMSVFRRLEIRGYTPQPDSGTWSYRREIIVRGAGVELKDYQLRIELDSSNFDFSKANPDGSDIRVTWVDPNTGDEVLVPIYIEEWDPEGEHAVIWVRVPEIPATGTVTLYLYYGNPSATSVSDPLKVFIFYDDFSQDPSASGWRIFTNVAQVWDSSNGWLVLTPAENGKYTTAYAPVALPGTQWVAEFRYRAGGGTGADGFTFMFYVDPSWGAGGSGGSLGFPGGYAVEFDNYKNPEYNDPTDNHIALISGSVQQHVAYYDDTGTKYTEDDQWHVATIYFDNGRVTVLVDGNEVLSGSLPSVDYTHVYFGFSGATGGLNNWHVIDWVRIRRFSPSEPSYTVGPEKSGAFVLEEYSTTFWLVYPSAGIRVENGDIAVLDDGVVVERFPLPSAAPYNIVVEYDGSGTVRITVNDQEVGSCAVSWAGNVQLRIDQDAGGCAVDEIKGLYYDSGFGEAVAAAAYQVGEGWVLINGWSPEHGVVKEYGYAYTEVSSETIAETAVLFAVYLYLQVYT